MEEKQIKQDRRKPGVISEETEAKIIRILQTDIPGNKKVYTGLIRIRGVSWAISNEIIKATLQSNFP